MLGLSKQNRHLNSRQSLASVLTLFWTCLCEDWRRLQKGQHKIMNDHCCFSDSLGVSQSNIRQEQVYWSKLNMINIFCSADFPFVVSSTPFSAQNLEGFLPFETLVFNENHYLKNLSSEIFCIKWFTTRFDVWKALLEKSTQPRGSWVQAGTFVYLVPLSTCNHTGLLE